MQGNKPSPPAPSYPVGIEGGGGGRNREDNREKQILDINKDDEDAIMLILQGWSSVNYFKNKYFGVLG